MKKIIYFLLFKLRTHLSTNIQILEVYTLALKKIVNGFGDSLFPSHPFLAHDREVLNGRGTKRSMNVVGKECYVEQCTNKLKQIKSDK